MFKAMSLWLFIGVALASSWPTSAAEIGLADDKQCLEQTAEYIGQVEIDKPTRKLIEEARKHYDDAEQPGRLKARTSGCQQIQMHLHLTPKFVPCFARGRPLEDEDGFKQIHIDLITAQHLEANPKAKDAVEAYFVCRATNAAATMMKAHHLFEVFKQ